MNRTFLRKAELSDLELLYSWVNDRTVRQNAFETHVITLDEHTSWFHNMMSDPDQIQFIMMEQQEPVGQIRFSIDGNEAEIDYSISPQYRGRGYGKEILRLGIEEISHLRPDIKKLIGKVKPSNTASMNCFLGNAFNEKYIALEFDLNDRKCPQ